MPDRTDLATFASTNLNASDADVLIKDDANPLKIFKFQASSLPEGTTTIDVATLGTVAGLLDDRGNYNASVNTFPATGGSGTGGAILKGDMWFISVAGTLGGVAVGAGDMLRALVDTPAQTASNWSILEANLGYVPAASGANSDITSLSGITTPLTIGQGGTGNALGVPTYPINRLSMARSDFLSISPLPDVWGVSAVNAGTFSNSSGSCVAATIDHPGTAGMLSSTSVNSGYRLISGLAIMLLGGGEESNFIFSLPAVVTTVTSSRLGFQDSLTVTDPVDGMYISIVDTTLKGDCISNSSETATASTYTLVAGTWYRVKISLNAAATLATFTLYSEAGAVLWTDTVATNIPTGAGRLTGHGVVSTNSGTVAVQLITLDYMDLIINRTLVR